MNLVIGSSSQLARYFPNDHVKISSRDVDRSFLKTTDWDSVYITFAEQRIYDKNIDFITPNYLYTLELIESLLDSAKRIVCYTSCELWNSKSGYITIDTAPEFYPLDNEYTISKLLLWNKIKERRQLDERYKKVIVLHPFYFNSVHRSDYFLFGKIFDSIVNRKHIDVGDLNFYRDMVHTKFAVEKSMEQTSDAMIGSGQLVNVKEFVEDLYTYNGLAFEEFVTEHRPSVRPGQQKLIMASVPWIYSYMNLLRDTLDDIADAKERL